MNITITLNHIYRIDKRLAIVFSGAVLNVRKHIFWVEAPEIIPYFSSFVSK